jgi:hypothetical protein
MSVENDEKRAEMAGAFFLIRTFHMLSSFGIRWMVWKRRPVVWINGKRDDGLGSVLECGGVQSEV